MDRRAFLTGGLAPLALAPIAVGVPAFAPLGDLVWASFDERGWTTGRALVLSDVSLDAVKALTRSKMINDRGTWEWWYPRCKALAPNGAQ